MPRKKRMARQRQQITEAADGGARACTGADGAVVLNLRRGPGAYALLSRTDGQLTRAGQHYYSYLGLRPPSRDFDYNQPLIREGPNALQRSVLCKGPFAEESALQRRVLCKEACSAKERALQRSALCKEALCTGACSAKALQRSVLCKGECSAKESVLQRSVLCKAYLCLHRG